MATRLVIREDATVLPSALLDSIDLTDESPTDVALTTDGKSCDPSF